MPFDPQTPPEQAQPIANPETATAAPSPAGDAAHPGGSLLPPDPLAARLRAQADWIRAYREWLPYWQQRDPVPPPPETAPEIETPGEVLTERQEAFCRAYAECPVAAKAARHAGYSPLTAKQQACRLLRHPLVIRRIHALREAGFAEHQVQRATLIDQAEAVFEAAVEKADYTAAMQALTMKARLAGFADYLPGVRIVRRPAGEFEQEFWARAHAAEQRIMAARLGELAGALPARSEIAAAQADAAMHAECAEAAATGLALRDAGEAERRARAKRAARL
jgi:phage terminase small subunit